MKRFPEVWVQAVVAADQDLRKNFREALQREIRLPRNPSVTGRSSVAFRSHLTKIAIKLFYWALKARRFATASGNQIRNRWRKFSITPVWRQVIWVTTGAALVTTATAATLIVQGYQEVDEQGWRKRLADWRMTPVYQTDRNLLGAIAPKESVAVDFYKNGFVDIGVPSKVFTDNLLPLEQSQYNNPWRTWCGLDPLATITRILSGGGGGSTLNMQLSKILLQQGDEIGFALVQRKFNEVGRACRLYRAVGHNGLLRAYSNVAPMLAWGGTTRGLATAQVLWGKHPDELEPFENAILAASVKHNIVPVPAEALIVGCKTLLADAATAINVRKQCLLFKRARIALNKSLSGTALANQLAKLAAKEKVGLSVANPWQPLPTRRVANLFARRAALLPTGAIEQLTAELDNPAHEPSEEVVVSLAQVQPLFAKAATDTLHQIETSAAPLLCAALTPNGTPRTCPGVETSQTPHAETNLLSANVRTGEIDRMYQSTRLGNDLSMRIGSVAKLVIAVAAVRRGWKDLDVVCPRRATAGGRVLRRVTLPYEGYTSCGRAELMSVADALMESDSLAMYNLAKQVGDQALRAAARDLGLSIDELGGQLSYQLAFGTQSATMKDLARMAQRVFGAAYEIPIEADPHLVRRGSVSALVNLHLRPLQARALRAMVEAPMKEGGTLEWASDLGRAGKSGTTSGIARASAKARPYVAGKLAVVFNPTTETLYVSAIHVPDPPHALGIHNLKGGIFGPVVALLAKDFSSKQTTNFGVEK